jgi:hypothetical protein
VAQTDNQGQSREVNSEALEGSVTEGYDVHIGGVPVAGLKEMDPAGVFDVMREPVEVVDDTLAYGDAGV